MSHSYLSSAGKSGLLVALASLCKVCKELLVDPQVSKAKGLPSPLQLIETALAECKKRDKEYKHQAIASLSILLTTFNHVDVYVKVNPTQSILEHCVVTLTS